MKFNVGCLAILGLLLCSFSVVRGQSDRGKIIKPGAAILDPNGDGFVSKTNAGFSFDGYYVDEFEIKMFGVPQLTGDVTGDNIGKNCGITDLIPDSTGHSVYAVRDVNNNLIFRFRVGDTNPSVEAWTILLDTDGLFGTNDPNATVNNPGFEIDITLIKNSNKGVLVYNINGIESCPSPLLTYDYSTHFQIAIADEVSCGDPDYFYDIYVPFTEIANAFGIDENTGLRYAAVTNVSATCAMAGKIADISGVDYNEYKDCVPCAFSDLINNQCPTPVVNLCEACVGFTSELVDAPTIDTPVRAGQTVISGTSQENIYITVEIYSRIGGTDAAPVWSTTPRETKAGYANGTIWAVTLNSLLLAYDKIVAKAQLTENSVPCGADGDNTASTSVTVVQPNDKPLALDQALTTPEETSLAITLTGTDPDGDPLTYFTVTNPSNGTLSGTAPNLTYTPNVNFNGSDSFTFNVSDGIYSADAVGVITITVTPVNDAPIANNQTVTTAEDTPIGITLTGSDVDGSPLTYTVQAQPLHGSLSGSGASLTYSPALNYNGPDNFTFVVNDGTVNSTTAIVTITVTPVNDAPVANNQSVTVIEDTPKAIALTATDPDGNTLIYSIVSPPSNGTLSGSGANFTYTPALNYNGGDSFTFKVNDGTTDSNIATVTITVTPVNDAPIANNQTVTTAEDTPIGITLTGSDVDGNPLTYTVQAQPLNGFLSGSGASLTYTPALNYNGPDNFTFVVNDGTVNSTTAIVTITVTPVNDAPVANNQSVTVIEDTPKAIALTATDPDGNTLIYSIVSAPTNGTLSGSGANFTYTPALNYNGGDSFTFKVNDGTTDSNIATVTITVTPVNDAPIANNQTVTTAEDTPIGITLTGSDVDGSPLTYTVQAQPLHGSLSGSGASLTYSPALNYNGPDNFTFVVNDGTVNSTTAIVTITVTPVNDAPVANNQSVTVIEDTPKAIALTATDPDGNTLIYSIVSPPSNGTLSGSGANFTYTPALNYNGGDSFTFKVNDGTTDSNIATVTITVTPVNDAPIANNLTVVYEMNTPEAFTLLASDTDGDILSYTLITLPANATITGTAPNLTFTPDLNFNGSTSFTFKVNDGTTDSNVGTVFFELDVLGNVAPVAQDQNVVTDEDVPKAIVLVANDVDGDALSYTITQPPLNGSISGTFPNITYTPNLNYNGSDFLKFKANDGAEDSNEGTTTITVLPINDAPTADDQSITLNENEDKAITLAGGDVDGDGITFSIQSQPAHGTLLGTAPNVTYTPALNYSGTDNFTFSTTDGNLNSTVATVSITVLPVNELPVAGNQSLTTDEDVNLNITLTATDQDGDALTYSITSLPANGILSGTAPNITYSPSLNFNGSDSFTFTVNDGSVNSSPASISITVNPINDAPIADSQSVTTQEDQPKNITLVGSDVDGDVLSFIVVVAPDRGSLSGSGSSLTYTPNSNYFGTDLFTFQASDGQVTSNVATVNINITPLNDAPVAVADFLVTDEDTPLTFTITSNDFDPDGTVDPSTVDLDPSTPAEEKTFTAPGEGSYTVNASGTVTFTPVLNYNGSATPISYTVKDNDGALSNAVAISVEVNPINDAPVPQDAVVTIDEDNSTQVCVVVTDVENDPSVITEATSSGGNGTVSAGTGALCFTYSPNPDFNGQDIVVVTVCDANDPALCNSATITINVTPVNDAPIIVVDNQPETQLSLTTAEDTPLNFCYDAVDVDGDITQLEPFTDTSPEGSLSVQPSGIPNRYCFLFEPTLDFNGTSNWELTICDGGNLCSALSIEILVTPVNDLPIAADQSVSTNEDTSLDILLTASDVDNNDLAFAIVSNPAHGTAILNGSTVTYNPAANYFGPDSFTFRANDGIASSNIATVTIVVLPVNDAPCNN